MLRHWTLLRAGGMGTVGHFPERGGTMNQAAIMLEAFAVMNGAEAEVRQDLARRRGRA